MESGSLAEANKLIATRLIEEVLTQGRVEVLDEIFARDADYEGPPPERLSGREGYCQTVLRLHSSFADAACEIEHILADGDRVGVRAQLRGRQTGEWATMPPCGREISFRIMHILEIHDGLITRYMDSRDEVSMWTQIGSVPVFLRRFLGIAGDGAGGRPGGPDGPPGGPGGPPGGPGGPPGGRPPGGGGRTTAEEPR